MKLWTGTQALVATVECTLEVYILGQFSSVLYSLIAEAQASIKTIGCEGWAERFPSCILSGWLVEGLVVAIYLLLGKDFA